MRYLIVYKTQGYVDNLIQQLKDFDGILNNIEHQHKAFRETAIETPENLFLFVDYKKISDMYRGHRFHHIVLENGVLDLLTEQQIEVISWSLNKFYQVFSDTQYFDVALCNRRINMIKGLL